MSKWKCKQCNKRLSDWEAWYSIYCAKCNVNGIRSKSWHK